MGVLQSVPGQYLRAKVDSGVQSRAYMRSQLWKSAGTNGQNFSVCRCRPKWPARSSLTGLRQRLSAAQRNPSSIRLVPWPLRFPGPLGHPPGHPRRSFRFGAISPLFCLARWGYLRPRAKTRAFHAQGGSGGVWVRKGAVQGPPIDPSNGPIAGLVERDTFFRTPRSGYGAARPPP